MRRLFEMSFYITLHTKAKKGRGGPRERRRKRARRREERLRGWGWGLGGLGDSVGSHFYNIRAVLLIRNVDFTGTFDSSWKKFTVLILFTVFIVTKIFKYSSNKCANKRRLHSEWEQTNASNRSRVIPLEETRRETDRFRGILLIRKSVRDIFSSKYSSYLHKIPQAQGGKRRATLRYSLSRRFARSIVHRWSF